MRTTVAFHWKLIWALAALVVLAATMCANAQGRGSGRKASQSGRAGAPPPPSGEKGSRTSASDGTLCRLIKFEYNDAWDDEPAAQLVAKPIGKNTKVLKLTISESDKPLVCLNQHKFDAYEAQDLLRKGLFCNVEWKYESVEPGRKPKTKEPVGMHLEPFGVHGMIVGIDDEYVTLKARPMKGADWPHLPVKDQYSRYNRTRSQTMSLKRRFRTLDETTVLRDCKSRPLALWDDSEGQEVEAFVILGKKEGILVTLRSLTVDE